MYLRNPAVDDARDLLRDHVLSYSRNTDGFVVSSTGHRSAAKHRVLWRRLWCLLCCSLVLLVLSLSSKSAPTRPASSSIVPAELSPADSPEPVPQRIEPLPPPVPEPASRKDTRPLPEPALPAAGRATESDHLPAVVVRAKRIFIEEGVPAELVWRAEVESCLDARARSRAGAVGLFQLMPATARRFGLTVGARDDRIDPAKNARAAARYLATLYGQFKSWPLAIAAYNAGEGRVRRSLRGLPRSYAAVRHRLPAQTRSYVPRVLDLVGAREQVNAGRLPPPSSLARNRAVHLAGLAR